MSDSQIRNVLDHGYVRLVDHMGSDLSVVRSARVSYDADWRAGEDSGSDAKLINYLMKHKHTSPFESVTFTFEISCPLFVARQWHRHRTWCLAGDTKIEFARPVDGKPYYLTIKDMADRWNAGEPKRIRKYRNLRQFNRDRIGAMLLRYRKEDGSIANTRVVDVWQSGVKEVFEVKAGDLTIKASADHNFLTDSGYVPVSELLGKKVCVRAYVGKESRSYAEFEVDRSSPEVWAEVVDGYEVSTYGRVRSYWGQGSRSKKENPIEKRQTLSANGRLVVGLGKRPVQVSRLVAEAFIDNPENLPFVCHRDDNPYNNQVSNLYWGNAKDNHDDSVKNGTRAARGFDFIEVVGITSAGEEPVYDMTVEADEHNFIANGFVVHNCYNEISARYAQLPNEMYLPEEDMIGVQNKDNKQMRDMVDIDPTMAMYFHQAFRVHNARCYALYEDLIEKGCPRELARGVLPTATYTRFFGTVNLHNLLKFIAERIHPHAQYEIRVYAQALLDLIESIVPVSVAAYRKHVMGESDDTGSK